MTAPRDPLAAWFTHGEYDDHDWSNTGSPSYCRGCHITFPAWNAARAALAPRPPETATLPDTPHNNLFHPHEVETADAGALDAAWADFRQDFPDGLGDDNWNVIEGAITKHRPLIEDAIRRDAAAATPALDVERAITIVEEAIIRWANEPAQAYSAQGNWQAYAARDKAVAALRAAESPTPEPAGAYGEPTPGDGR